MTIPLQVPNEQGLLVMTPATVAVTVTDKNSVMSTNPSTSSGEHRDDGGTCLVRTTISSSLDNNNNVTTITPVEKSSSNIIIVSSSSSSDPSLVNTGVVDTDAVITTDADADADADDIEAIIEAMTVPLPDGDHGGGEGEGGSNETTTQVTATSSSTTVNGILSLTTSPTNAATTTTTTNGSIKEPIAVLVDKHENGKNDNNNVISIPSSIDDENSNIYDDDVVVVVVPANTNTTTTCSTNTQDIMMALESDESEDELQPSPKKKGRRRKTIPTISSNVALESDESEQELQSSRKKKKVRKRKSIPTINSTSSSSSSPPVDVSSSPANTDTKTSALVLFPIGTIISKQFEAPHGPYYEGTIMSYDSPRKFYHINYTDGDREDLTHAEVQALWVFPMGTRIRKQFEAPHGPYYDGTIMSYDSQRKFYHIKYTDGDREDFTHAEVHSHQTTTQTGASASASANANASANNDTVQFGVSVPAPDIGSGWTMIVQQRAFSAGRKQSIYRYYYTPKHQIRLRSKPEVERFQSALQALHENDDDEDNENDENESDGDDEYDEMLAYEKAFGKKAHCGSNKEERVVVVENQKKKDSTVTNTVTNNIVKRNDPPPRRPPSSYVAYLNYHREQAKLDHPTTPKGEISKLLTTRWHKLSDQQQQEFKIKSGNQQEFDIYNSKLKAWKARHGNPSIPKSRKNKNNNNNNSDKNNNKTEPKKKRKRTVSNTKRKKKQKRGSSSSYSWVTTKFSNVAYHNLVGNGENEKDYEYIASCIGCGKQFKNNAGLVIHVRFCDPYKSVMANHNNNNPNDDDDYEGDDEVEVEVDQNGVTWYVVEDVRNQRINPKTKKEEYLLKWKDCPESDNTWEEYATLDPIIQRVAKDWYHESQAEETEQQQRDSQREVDMKRLGLADNDNDDDNDDDNDEDNDEMSLEEEDNIQRGLAEALPSSSSFINTSRKGKPIATTKEMETNGCLEDTTWAWDEVSQIQYRDVRRIDVNHENCRQLVTEARINGTPIVLTGHRGWTQFAKRWLRRRPTSNSNDDTATTTVSDDNKATVAAAAATTATKTATKTGTTTTKYTTTRDTIASTSPPTSAARDETVTTISATATVVKGVMDSILTRLEQQTATTTTTTTASGEEVAMDTFTSTEDKDAVVDTAITSVVASTSTASRNRDVCDDNDDRDTNTMIDRGDIGDNTTALLDLSDPSWYLDVQAMSEDIGNEEVPVVKRNYNESKPISGNILASKFFEAAWPTLAEIETQQQQLSSSSSSSSTLLSPLSPTSTKKLKKKKKAAALYLHQWQFPLSEVACTKLCHKSVPLPHHILGEDLLKYWLDRVKLDSPLQYLFMGREDTMSKIHKDPGGLAITIAPITGEKGCILVHRDDGHACLYHTRASLDPEAIDLDAYPLLPYARIWKTSIVPGEILLMPHGTYHQCRNITPCLSYSRFHLDVVNLRAFLLSLFDGDAPELHQDEVLWNATQELIGIIDQATDEKRTVNPQVVDAVEALRALRNITREITRKLHIRQTVKGISSTGSASLLSAVKIDGDMEIWQKLVDDIDITLHEFRYRFSTKLPALRKKRLVGKKILALPAMVFRGKAIPANLEEMKGRHDEPVVAFECPTDRGFLSLSAAPSTTPTDVERKVVTDAIDLVVTGDTLMVRIEGRQCSGTVMEIMEDLHVAYMSFEDLPSLYNDYLPCDLIRIPSVSGSSLLVESPLTEIQPGKLMVGLIGKEEYRGIVQHVFRGKMFKVTLDFGNNYTVDRLINAESIISVTTLLHDSGGDDDDKKKKKKDSKMDNNQISFTTDPIMTKALELTNTNRKETTGTNNKNEANEKGQQDVIKETTEYETVQEHTTKEEKTKEEEVENDIHDIVMKIDDEDDAILSSIIDEN